jgi:hypothetical protein
MNLKYDTNHESYKAMTVAHHSTVYLAAAAIATALGLAGCAGDVKNAQDAVQPATVTAVVTETVAAEPLATVGNDDQSPPTTDAAAIPSDGSTTAKIGDTITLGTNDTDSAAITLLEYRTNVQSNNEYLGPGPGERWVAVRIRIKNVGSTTFESYSPSSNAKVVDADDQEFGGETFGADSSGLATLEELRIRPDAQRTGWIVFTVPKNTKLKLFTLAASFFAGDQGEWRLAK